jgi:protein SCO1/2
VNLRARLAATLALALLLAGAATLWLIRAQEPQPALIAGAYDPPRPAPGFTLDGTDGAPVTLESFRGKVVLLTFGFTHCAAVCPTTLATLAQARSALGVRAKEVQVVFVTVDPERDTIEQMRPYLAAFDPTFVGATGDPTALAAARGGYGVTAVREGDGPDYAMAHTSSIFLIDRAGRLRAMMPFGHDAADFVHDVGLLLEG